MRSKRNAGISTSGLLTSYNVDALLSKVYLEYAFLHFGHAKSVFGKGTRTRLDAW